MFPDRGLCEVTCGWLYDADTKGKLCAASENQTYNSIRVKHTAGGKGIITYNSFGFDRKAYVDGGRVQCKESGRVWT